MSAANWFWVGVGAIIIVSIVMIVYIFRDAFGGDEDADIKKL